MATIAHQYGFDRYQTIWDHPENSGLKELRKNPNVLHPGDSVFIPEKVPREEGKGSDAAHSFVRRGPTTKLRLRLEDIDQEPHANLRYKLEIGKQVIEGQTGADGM